MKEDEYNWVDKPIIGLALLLKGGSIDSYGDQLDGERFYMVGKHKENGKVAIIPTKTTIYEASKD